MVNPPQAGLGKGRGDGKGAEVGMAQGFFGVYDGHCGSEAVQFVRDRLHSMVGEHASFWEVRPFLDLYMCFRFFRFLLFCYPRVVFVVLVLYFVVPCVVYCIWGVNGLCSVTLIDYPDHLYGFLVFKGEAFPS